MIFYSITPDGHRRHAAAGDSMDTMRQVIGLGGDTDLLEEFDTIARQLPKNMKRSLRERFVTAYLAVLTSLLPQQSNYDNVPQFFADLKSAIEAVGSELGSSEEVFRNALADPMRRVRRAIESVGVDLQEQELEAEETVEQAPADAQAPAGEQAPDEQPAPEEVAPSEEMEAPSTTHAEMSQKMAEKAKNAAQNIVPEFSEEFARLPEDIQSIITRNSGFNANEFAGMLADFISRLIGGMGDRFDEYFLQYGKGGADSTSVASSVFQDFSQVGRAFLFQMLDYACTYASDYAESKEKKQEYKNYADQFDTREKKIWRDLSKGKAASLVPPAKSMSEAIGRSKFPSQSVHDRAKKKKGDLNVNLYTPGGYEKLYDGFIKEMKELSAYSGWQSMLNSFSQPGTIEHSGIDKMQVVWDQARADASSDKEAKRFLKLFGRDINLPAMHGISKAKIESGQNSFKNDKNPDRFVEYLLQQIASAAGRAADGPEQTDFEKVQQKVPTPNLPIPKGGGGPGTTAYTLGILFLLAYGAQTKIHREQERLKLNTPEERLQLNQPEERLQLNQPQPNVPAAPAAPAAQAPATPGG